MTRRSTAYVLDTSALLALIEAEEGGLRVRHILGVEHVLIPFMVLLELRYITLRERGQAEADLRYAAIKQTRAQLMWEVNEPILLAAARLKASRRISMGDALIAAFAIAHGAVLVHKDPELEVLSDVVTLETLPLKQRR